MGDTVSYNGRQMRVAGFPIPNHVTLTALVMTVGEPSTMTVKLKDILLGSPTVGRSAGRRV